MRKLVLSVALAMTVVTGIAPALAQDGNGISNERTVQLREQAESVCPAAFRSADVNAYIDNYAQTNKLKGPEVLLLQAFCIMYGRGYIAGRDAK